MSPIKLTFDISTFPVNVGDDNVLFVNVWVDVLTTNTFGEFPFPALLNGGTNKHMIVTINSKCP